MEKYRRTIRGLKAAGVKTVLVTGLKEEEARKVALATTIMRTE